HSRGGAAGARLSRHGLPHRGRGEPASRVRGDGAVAGRRARGALCRLRPRHADVLRVGRHRGAAVAFRGLPERGAGEHGDATGAGRLGQRGQPRGGDRRHQRAHVPDRRRRRAGGRAPPLARQPGAVRDAGAARLRPRRRQLRRAGQRRAAGGGAAPPAGPRRRRGVGRRRAVVEGGGAHMSADAQRWLPLAPAAVVTLYWFIGLAVFTVHSAIWGVRHDRELEARGKSILIGNFLKSYFSWIVRPLWRVILASGISPNAVTVIAMILGGVAGVAGARGPFGLRGAGVP